MLKATKDLRTDEYDPSLAPQIVDIPDSIEGIPPEPNVIATDLMDEISDDLINAWNAQHEINDSVMDKQFGESELSLPGDMGEGENLELNRAIDKMTAQQATSILMPFFTENTIKDKLRAEVERNPAAAKAVKEFML